jgi:outer membrane protein
MHHTHKLFLQYKQFGLHIAFLSQMRFILLILCCSLYASAQKKLSLIEAWRLAEQNSAILQKTEETALATADVALARRLKLPTVNAQYQSPLNLGRSIDPYTNTFDTRTILGNTYNVSASYTLFDNGQIKSQIRAAENYQKALGMEKAVAINDLKYQVLLAYCEILLAQEQINTLHTQIKTTKDNLSYLDKLFKADRLRYASLLTMEAENERLQSELQNAEAELQVSKTKLKRLINNTSEIQAIETLPTRYTFSTDQIVTAAYGQLPEMKAFGFYRKQKQEEENLLYAQRLPMVSAFSNLGTTYSSAAKEIVRNELRTMGYFDQFGNNLNMNVGLGVSIPIFNSVNYRQKLQRNAIEQKIIWHHHRSENLIPVQTLDIKQENTRI